MRDDLIAQYAKLHKESPSYGSGRSYYQKIREICIRKGYESAIDFGCGKGLLANDLNCTIPRMYVHKYDPAIPKFSKSPPESEFLIANDVFEHFHPDDVYKELIKVNNLARKGIFVNISCRPAVHHLPNGMNCHTTVFPWDRWMDICNKYFIGKTLAWFEWNRPNNNIAMFYDLAEQKIK